VKPSSPAKPEGLSQDEGEALIASEARRAESRRERSSHLQSSFPIGKAQIKDECGAFIAVKLSHRESAD